MGQIGANTRIKQTPHQDVPRPLVFVGFRGGSCRQNGSAERNLSEFFQNTLRKQLSQMA